MILAWPREIQHLQAKPAKQANRPIRGGEGGWGGQGPIRIRGITLYAYVGNWKYSLAILLENNREVKQKTHLNRLNESTFGYFFENLVLFRIVSVCYETDLFVSVVSIKVRNTETNRNILFLVSRNKPKQTRNRSCFGLFRFEPKYFFVCFEDTLLQSHGNDAESLLNYLLELNRKY